jgi:hypothetical protein
VLGKIQGALWKQTVMVKRICYKNQEPMILAMNPGMRLIGWGGDFYSLRIFAVSYRLCNLSTGIC